MATTIRAKTTFRNSRELPNGIIRRGQTATVRDRYAEELFDKGLAVVVTEDNEPPEWADMELPDDTPQRSKLVDSEILTLGGLKKALDSGEVGEITGIGPAREDQIREFFESFIE